MKIEREYTDEDALIAEDKIVDYFVVCDVCGERIDAERPGLATWGRPDIVTRSVDEDVTREGDVTFVHKGRCDDKKSDRSWMDADRFFWNLLHSMGSDEVDRELHQD